jgi:hypothetical protein
MSDVKHAVVQNPESQVDHNPLNDVGLSLCSDEGNEWYLTSMRMNSNAVLVLVLYNALQYGRLILRITTVKLSG